MLGQTYHLDNHETSNAGALTCEANLKDEREREREGRRTGGRKISLGFRLCTLKLKNSCNFYRIPCYFFYLQSNPSNCFKLISFAIICMYLGVFVGLSSPLNVGKATNNLRVALKKVKNLLLYLNLSLFSLRQACHTIIGFFFCTPFPRYSTFQFFFVLL